MAFGCGGIWRVVEVVGEASLSRKKKTKCKVMMACLFGAVFVTMLKSIFIIF
jgi:hypothetical protein